MLSQLHSLQVRASTLAGSGNWSMSVTVHFGKFFYRMPFTVYCSEVNDGCVVWQLVSNLCRVIINTTVIIHDLIIF